MFRRRKNAPRVPSPQDAAALLLRLAATVVDVAGAEIVADEGSHASSLEWALQLSPAERQWLRHHLAWLLAATPARTGLTQRVAAMAPPQWRGLTAVLVAITGRDGHFSPLAITTLVTFYRLLGASAADICTDVRARGAPAAEPVTIRAASAVATSFPIPPPTSDSASSRPPSVPLDWTRIEATVAETAAVSAVLAAVFTDDQGARCPAAADTEAAWTRARLDRAHAALIRALATRHLWRRADVVDLCGVLGLFPDGTLEQINGAAFERCGAPLCDGEEPIEVSARVAQELLA